MANDVLDQIFSLQTAAWTANAILLLFVVRMWNGAPAMFAQWIAYRRAKAEEKSSDWSRLREEITRLDSRCDDLQTEVDECRKREGDWMGRAIAAESALAGRGQAAQEVTILQSKRRLADKGE